MTNATDAAAELARIKANVSIHTSTDAIALLLCQCILALADATEANS